ncbi:MAG: hypothetical protein NVS9B15_19890 [Acidobacteriaceae bacterium]
MYCNSCGAAIPAGAAFCSKCGTSIPGQTASAPGGSTTAHQGLSENSAAAIAYITIIPAIVFLILEPYNRMRLVRFHAWQCIFLSVASIAIHIVLGLVPGYHWMLQELVSLLFLVVWILCAVKASRGEYYKLPAIGDLAEQQAGK